LRFRIFIAIAVVGLLIAYVFKLRREQVFVESLSQQTDVTGAIAAREGVEEVTRIAKLWDQECFLQCVRIAFAGDLENNPAIAYEGRPIPPSGWMYRFFSPRRKKFLMLTLSPDGHCQAETASAINYLDSQPLPDNFLDSTEAFQIAEESFGREFRQDVDVFRMYAQVTTWPSNVGGPEDPVPHRANWQIQYLAQRGNRTRVDLYLMIDAVTGKLLTAQKAVNSEMQVIHSNFGNH